MRPASFKSKSSPSSEGTVARVQPSWAKPDSSPTGLVAALQAKAIQLYTLPHHFTDLTVLFLFQYISNNNQDNNKRQCFIKIVNGLVQI